MAVQSIDVPIAYGKGIINQYVFQYRSNKRDYAPIFYRLFLLIHFIITILCERNSHVTPLQTRAPAKNY